VILRGFVSGFDQLRASQDAARCLVLAAAVASAACTFYTGPPPPPPGAAAPSAGAGQANGGNASGDSDAGSGNADSNGADTGNSGGGSAITGMPTGKFSNVTTGLYTLANGGIDLSLISSVPNASRVIAGIGHKGLFESDDGSTWSALGSATGSDPVSNSPTAIIYDPVHPKVYWESGIYGAGVFRTDDAGQTFALLGNSYHCDLMSVDFTDAKRKTLLAGGHEVVGILWLSKDGGDTWTDIGGNLPTGQNFSTLPLIIDTKTFLVGSCGNTAYPCSIMRSEDGGDTWKIVSDKGPMARPLWASNGDIYWTLWGDAGGMLVSKDQGKTWTPTSSGPAVLAYSASPIELPDGRILTLQQDYPIVTDDEGQTWKRVGGKLPFPAQNCGTYSITYSTGLKTLFISHNDCSGVFLKNALWSVPFDYESE